MIQPFYIFESLLRPRKLDDRQKKYALNLASILRQEHLDGDLELDPFNFNSINQMNPDDIRLTSIRGSLNIIGLQILVLPEWMSRLSITDTLSIFNTDISDITNIPQKVGNELILSHNKNLTSIEELPQVGTNIHLSNNSLTSLKGAPETVNGLFDCSYNYLESLEYAPKSIKENFKCNNNLLTTLEYSPLYVGANYVANNNPLKTLEHLENVVIAGRFLTDIWRRIRKTLPDSAKIGKTPR